MNPEDVPDKTLDELADNDEFEDWGQDDIDEMVEENEDLWLMAQYTATATGLAMLLVDGVITFREYEEYVEHIEDKARENDVQLP